MTDQFDQLYEIVCNRYQFLALPNIIHVNMSLKVITVLLLYMKNINLL